MKKWIMAALLVNGLTTPAIAFEEDWSRSQFETWVNSRPCFFIAEEHSRSEDLVAICSKDDRTVFFLVTFAHPYQWKYLTFSHDFEQAIDLEVLAPFNREHIFETLRQYDEVPLDEMLPILEDYRFSKFIKQEKSLNKKYERVISKTYVSDKYFFREDYNLATYDMTFGILAREAMSAEAPSNSTRSSQAKGLYPYTSTLTITSQDLRGKSCRNLWIMRNEIYARYGVLFNDDEVRAYFLAQSWYSPSAAASYDDLSVLERQNAKTILAFEKAQKCL